MTNSGPGQRSSEPSLLQSTSYLPLSALEEAFPCHVVFDRDLSILGVGEGLGRACPHLGVAMRLDRAFRIRRPPIPCPGEGNGPLPLWTAGAPLARQGACQRPPPLPFSFAAIQEHLRAPFVLETLSGGTLVQGRMIHVEVLDVMILLASSWTTRVEKLADLGLDLDDFATHDSHEGFLALVSARNAALEEANLLARQLALESAELAAARRRLSARSGVLAAIASRASLDEAAGKVLGAVCGGYDWAFGAWWVAEDKARPLVCRAIWKESGDRFLALERAFRAATLAPGEGLPGRARAAGAPVAVEDLARETEGDPLAAAAIEDGLSSALALPVHAGAEVAGVMLFLGRETRREESAELGLLLHAALSPRARCARCEIRLQAREALGQRAGRVAHDFNNLLMVMSGSAEILAMDIDAASPLAVEVEEIRKACARGTALTRQLMASGGGEAPPARPVDLNSLLADLSSMLRRLLGDGVELVLSCEPGLGAVLADPGQLEQAIVNLAVNARDAMPGGGTLTIETGMTPPEDDPPRAPRAVLSVRDTGCGMGPATLARIFEPFFTTKGPGKGTGLGLSIVQGIVTRLGGSLTVETEPGMGTTFRIVLPRA